MNYDILVYAHTIAKIMISRYIKTFLLKLDLRLRVKNSFQNVRIEMYMCEILATYWNKKLLDLFNNNIVTI